MSNSSPIANCPFFNILFELIFVRKLRLGCQKHWLEKFLKVPNKGQTAHYIYLQRHFGDRKPNEVKGCAQENDLGKF